MNTNSNTVKIFLKDLDEFFYGPNFWQAGLFAQVKDLTLEQALWKPSPDRHCIWDILLHVNSWKWFAVECLKGNKIESMKEINWTNIPEQPDETKWKNEIERTEKLHKEFKALIANASPEMFEPSRENMEYYQQVLYHDCYHTGQIGMLRALQGIKPIT
jgi:hypothetical protein